MSKSFLVETNGIGFSVYDAFEMAWTDIPLSERFLVTVPLWSENLLVRNRSGELEERRGLLAMGFLNKIDSTWYLTDSPNPSNKAS